MSSSLTPNKIHSLPVRVSYYLPTTSQIFSTLFSIPQQVYVHPPAATGTSTKLGEDEAWGSIYLKTVVTGVLMASPELHPSYPCTPDLSLYVLDPRETYLRRSRTGSSPYIAQRRNQNVSSPLSEHPSSDNLPYGISQPPTVQEVWTGKGLVSWALEEPGQGKNLITGRLIRSSDFATVSKSQGLDPLEALMMADMNMSDSTDHEQENWGIEISVGLKSGVNGSVGLHNQIPGVMATDPRPDALRRSSTSSSIGTNVPLPLIANTNTNAHATASSSQFQRPHLPLPKRHEQPRRPQLPTPSSSSSAHQPLAPTRVVSLIKSTPVRPSEVKPPRSSGSNAAGKKRKSHTPAARNSLTQIDANSDPLKRKSTAMAQAPPPVSKRHSGPPSESAEPFPTDIPAGLFAKPESLTREQAQRLLASPAFLSMLEKLTGAPIDVAAAAKRAREGDDEEGSNGKKPKHLHGHARKGSTDASGEPAHNAFVCWNCGRSKSAVWRTKVMEDGKSVRVCNACGLYWNKMGSMRPPTLWGDVDDDPKDRPRKDKKVSASAAARQSSQPPVSEPDIPALRIDKPSARSSDNGFKRTLSSVVEQDAKRIAALNIHPRRPLPKSNLNQTSKPIPVSSPPRGSTSATKSLRDGKRNDVTASSPGAPRWSESHSNNVLPRSDNFHTDPVEPPATTSSKAYESVVSHSENNTQSLDMPLSDDGDGNTHSVEHKPLEWGRDLSAFFDVEGFSMPPPQQNNNIQPLDGARTYGISPNEGPTDFHRSLSAETRKLRKQASSHSSSGSGFNGHVGTDQSTEEDDVLSQLFNRTSSVGPIESSPHPFDFSALPPSSPPIPSSSSELPHSALLLSSPDNSPIGFSPLEQNQKTTPGKSRLRHSISANNNENYPPSQHHHYGHHHQIQHQKQFNQQMLGDSGPLDIGDIQRMLSNIGSHQQDQKPRITSPDHNQPNQDQGYDMIHDFFGKLGDQNPNQNHEQHHATSSVGQADELIGGQNINLNHDDIFAMLEGMGGTPFQV
ncbi:uncharacterized protein IL334_003527 [Kwoniella shivajii]|uniref:GATA-type domain-containing protein n=1 Tax=Kwoniella shivajii TaxID=564305 RepID=A0ABZ1CYC9_9TREE|nr:hypothetical protein IL334_003527 [Kwoniella shivajii]